MSGEIKLTEKYERNGWPSITRPDLKPPEGWSLDLITAVNRIYNHSLSPTESGSLFIWDREDLSDIYTLPAAGGWPARISFSRTLVPYWDDELPRWSPDSCWLAFTLDGHVHLVRQTAACRAKSATSPQGLPLRCGCQTARG